MIISTLPPNPKAKNFKIARFQTPIHTFPFLCNCITTELTPKRSKENNKNNNQNPTMEAKQNAENTLETLASPVEEPSPPAAALSKRAQKKLAKLEMFMAKKAEKKAEAKERRREEVERKRREWEEKLAGVTAEERDEVIQSRRSLRKERMEKRSEEKELKIQRLTEAKTSGQNIVIDLDFSHLMTPSEINSLVHQIMYCYAMNGKCANPSHLWLTGCSGEMGTQFKRISGFDKWIIEKEDRSYIEALQDRKDDLVYLTADSETVLGELDPKKMYIIGGLVDRNRWKGLTMEKAKEQGIQTAKLPIGNYLKMSSSQVLTVNQVIEILLKFLETKDWRTAFFQVIPLRKRGETETEECQYISREENPENRSDFDAKRQCIEVSSNGLDDAV